MKKPVIVISSHVARGSVGNRAAGFALEVRGFPVWAIPTVTLPFHPGHDPATRLLPPDEGFRDFLADLAGSKWISEVGGILTGYMGSAEQVEAVGEFITNLKATNPQLLYTCDPVMGDGASPESENLYIGEETAFAIRDHLLPLADILTPNRFELAWLSGQSAAEQADAIHSAASLGRELVLVTSMPGLMKGNMANLLISKQGTVIAEHRQMKNPPNGPGDLTAALFLSHLLDGTAPVEALRLTTSSVFEIVSGAVRRGADELMLETDQLSITRPATQMQTRTIKV